MKLDWKHYAVIVLMLGVMAAWGSREVHFKKTQDDLILQTQQLTTKLAESESSVKHLTLIVATSTHTVTRKVPVQFPGGVIAYMDETVADQVADSSSTFIQQHQKQVDELTNQNNSLQEKLKLSLSKTVSPAPMWNIVAGWQPLSQTYFAGGGVNVGALSLSLDNPVLLKLEPRLTLMLRI